MRLMRRCPALPSLALAFALAACAPTLTPTPTLEPTPTPTASPSPTPTSSPTPSATPSAPPTAAPTTGGPPGGFTIRPNAEADALFLVRDDCENPSDGYELAYPDDWWTNTEIGAVPACSWFSPTSFEVPDPSVVPAEIAIVIERVKGDIGSFENPISREEIIVGGLAAIRVEYPDAYLYQIQLGPTMEEGPNLIARTTPQMGGDYELNKAVLDRMMATIEFMGSVQ
jgi:hypothetical protein